MVSKQRKPLWHIRRKKGFCVLVVHLRHSDCWVGVSSNLLVEVKSPEHSTNTRASSVWCRECFNSSFATALLSYPQNSLSPKIRERSIKAKDMDFGGCAYPELLDSILLFLRSEIIQTSLRVEWVSNYFRLKLPLSSSDFFLLLVKQDYEDSFLKGKWNQCSLSYQP